MSEQMQKAAGIPWRLRMEEAAGEESGCASLDLEMEDETLAGLAERAAARLGPCQREAFYRKAEEISAGGASLEEALKEALWSASIGEIVQEALEQAIDRAEREGSAPGAG